MLGFESLTTDTCYGFDNMKELGHKLDTSSGNSSKDGDVRSPRTPTYVPSSSNSFTIPPFDPSRIFALFSPSQAVKQAAPLPSPTKPLAWVWQCHLCRSRYPLGATRRCLLDGHYYCSGEADRSNPKKGKRGQSCLSEFDYIGWRDMTDWQRKWRKIAKPNSAHSPQGCENCEFPSQCQYGNQSLLGAASEPLQWRTWN